MSYGNASISAALSGMDSSDHTGDAGISTLDLLTKIAAATAAAPAAQVGPVLDAASVPADADGVTGQNPAVRQTLSQVAAPQIAATIRGSVEVQQRGMQNSAGVGASNPGVVSDKDDTIIPVDDLMRNETAIAEAMGQLGQEKTAAAIAFGRVAARSMMDEIGTIGAENERNSIIADSMDKLASAGYGSCIKPSEDLLVKIASVRGNNIDEDKLLVDGHAALTKIANLLPGQSLTEDELILGGQYAGYLIEDSMIKQAEAQGEADAIADAQGQIDAEAYEQALAEEIGLEIEAGIAEGIAEAQGQEQEKIASLLKLDPSLAGHVSALRTAGAQYGITF